MIEQSEAASERSPLPRKRDDVWVHDFGEEYVIHDKRTGKVHVLNRPAHTIWQKCDGTATFGDLLAEFHRAQPGVPAEVLMKDLAETLEALRAKSLVL